ncbi:hypothetical protein FCH79_04080 [Pseudomonas koreensis]|nr:hypothetical protein [Pseudomonas koreensis]
MWQPQKMSGQAQAPQDTGAAGRLQRLTTKHRFPSSTGACGSEPAPGGDPTKAVCQPANISDVPASSRAGSLPQGSRCIQRAPPDGNPLA